MTAEDTEINRAYSAQGTISPDSFTATMTRYREESDAATRGLQAHRNIAYHESGQLLDVFAPGTPARPRPAVLAVHGGYWRMLSREDTLFMARTLDEAGISTIAVDYTLAPAATIEEMIDQVRAAVAWIHHEGPSFGLDPGHLVVLGSSAGAHLAASTLVSGWTAEVELPDPAVSGAMLLSGLYDLRPLTRTFAQEWLQLTEARAAAVSPLLGAPMRVPVVVARAENEASAFHDQSRALAHHWRDEGELTQLREMVVPARNHFDIFLDLAAPTSDLSRELVALVHGQTTS